jgi:iron complex outermembrane recepter protein
MPTYRFSPLHAAIVSALAFTLSSPVFAAEDSVSEGSSLDVMVVNGSQITLGDEYEGGQVARSGRVGMLGNVDFMDTPFSTSSYTEQLIRDQQAESVADVLENDATVRVATGYGNFQELYMIRGFNVYSDDMTLNGVYGILPRQFVAAEMIERVEVFRGANSFVNGAAPGGSAIGGLVNIVPKRADSEPLTRVTVGTQTGGQGYAAMDVGRRFGDEKEDGLRTNIIVRDGETGVDDEDKQLGALTLGYDHQGSNFRLSADLGYQDHHIDSPRPSVTPSGAIPSAVDASSNYAQNWTYTDENQLFGVVRGEYDLAKNTSAWLALGTRQGKEHNLLANPTVDSDGNLTAYLFENIREDSVISSDAGVRHNLTLGSIGHTIVVSGSAYQSKSKNAYVMSWPSTSVGSLDDYQQIEKASGAYFGGDMDSPTLTEKISYSSLALADTLSLFSDSVRLTLGGRLQHVDTTSYDYSSGAVSGHYAKSALTPSVGAVYFPIENTSLYANYAEALEPGKTAPATATNNAGVVMKPLRSEQFELGVKYDNETYGATASLFQISKPSYITEDNTYTDNGEQRNQGLELSMFGKPTENTKLIAGATWIDAELANTEDGTYDGNSAIGVAKFQANVNLEWDAPQVQGLTLEGRTVYTAAQYADQANTTEIPAWTRFDLGARYVLPVDESDLTLRARVENVTDESYWSSVGGYPGSNYLVLGSPRTVMLSASYDF